MQITKPGRGDEERERRRKGNGAGLEANVRGPKHKSKAHAGGQG